MSGTAPSDGLAIEVSHVTLELNGSNVIDDVSLALPHGEFLGVIGPNGAGKTMLLRVLLGLVAPTKGHVRVLGEPPERARARVGYVPQHARFPRDFPIRVEDVVLMGRLGKDRLGRPLGSADRDAVRRALAKLGIEALADRQIGALSGGQLQRVLVARALVHDPEVLFLDEPTASLDPRAASSLYGSLASMRERRTVVMVAHDVGVITQHVSSVACMNRKLFVHHAAEVSREMIEATYGTEMGVVIHTHPHDRAR